MGHKSIRDRTCGQFQFCWTYLAHTPEGSLPTHPHKSRNGPPPLGAAAPGGGGAAGCHLGFWWV